MYYYTKNNLKDNSKIFKKHLNNYLQM